MLPSQETEAFILVRSGKRFGDHCRSWKRRQGSFRRTVYKEIHMFDPSWKSPVTSVFDKQGNVGNEILMIWRLGGKKHVFAVSEGG